MPGWEGSNRRSTLPPDWYVKGGRRDKVIARDKGKCQWETPGTGIYGTRGNEICGAPGTDVDHAGDHPGSRDDHRLSNLRLLCGPHHDARSAAQGGNSFIPLRRPVERHPALG